MCWYQEHRRETPQPRVQEDFLREGTVKLRFEAGVGTVTPNICIDGISDITNYPKI